MSQLIYFSIFAKGQFLNEHNCTQGHVGVQFLFSNLSLLLIKKWTKLTFWSSLLSLPTLWKTPVGAISVASTVSEVISAPSVLILYITQPPKLFFFHSHFHFQAEQTVLSFLPFFPHSSISVIALFPGIERSCHSLSRSRWLKCPSGGHSNAAELWVVSEQFAKLFTPRLVSPRLLFSSLELTTSRCFLVF